MEINFSGKRALVTGAGQGIGRGIAKALAKGGAETYALSRTKKYLDTLKEEDPRIHIHQIDVTDWEKTCELVESLGPIDMLVNNAGMVNQTAFVDLKPEEFDQTMAVNVKAVINVSQVVAKGMIKHGKKGAIVNLSSMGAMVALAGGTTYCASKAALDAITRVMAIELGPHQIRVNSVNPTIVLNTNMSDEEWNNSEEGKGYLDRTPMGKFSEVKDVVHPVLYLLSDQADMIHGITMPVDGGYVAC